MIRPRILLVDDDPGVRAAITFALEVEGFDVEGYPNAEAALAAPHRRIVCAVLDQRLPGMDGLSLLARLRDSEPSLPAIIITSNTSKRVRAEIAAKNTILVEKPLLRHAIVDVIRHIAAEID
ncbi:response regulator [Novosphingobium malaysiense]|uniref:Response regulatory domain-containing protein n=1 Tax=Novosphingobium malaysiense TaxID=1348853 RepID=A0A0B1ZFD4_9SPHN|nr:response regulator [Novosphingobium malaysiense]KHK89205.1 hypothetical protein LK12_22085 [Novosphingobium malaysiense]